MPASFKIAPLRVQDAEAVERLIDKVLGPGRFARTAYRLREAAPAPAPGLSLCAWQETDLAGAVSFWPIRIGTASALLLGPLVVARAYQGKGAGLALLQAGCRAAEKNRHQLVILVGDPPYYARAGFIPVPPGQMTLPGPVDYGRLLMRELRPGAGQARGPVRGG